LGFIHDRQGAKGGHPFSGIGSRRVAFPLVSASVRPQSFVEPLIARPMLEKRHQPLLPKRRFLLRLLRSAIAAFCLTVLSLGIGTLGYHFLEQLSWLDSLLSAAMILTGMGPVYPTQTTAGKFFATAYALFSGIVFLGVAGLMVVPILHRFLHAFHLDGEAEERPQRNRRQ
jgi:hypothetical protein